VFDDGVFTYLRLPGNREIPAVFHVAADGQETLTNTRMETDLLVVDRVCPRRFKFEPPCRRNIEPGVEADVETVGCG
jgi:type IV secretory pathway VirB9-like protein